MQTDTRYRMVLGAADLISRRGISGTSVREVVRCSGTPRGSLAHHFPGGRQQLVGEAIVLAGESISRHLARLVSEQGLVEGVRSFVAGWRQRVESTDFEAGCPVLAACVEHVDADVRPREAGEPSNAAQQHLLALARVALNDWQEVLAGALRREGIKPARARRLASLAVAAVEGAVAMSRAERSLGPLRDVEAELLAVFADAIDTG